jgi:DNA mismatch endonuclease, patch repair protein
MKETAEARSRIMRAVKGADTGPEMTVRRMVHNMGYRFRLHRNDLPGKPDLVFARLRKVIFVHGCFWHGHNCARGARVPKRNRAYWIKKISGNRVRDQRNKKELAAAGWKSLIIWECKTRNQHALITRVEGFLAQ